MKHCLFFTVFGSTTPNELLNCKGVINNIDVIDLEIFGREFRYQSCKKLPFVNRAHGHFITGVLQFIEKEIEKAAK